MLFAVGVLVGAAGFSGMSGEVPPSLTRVAGLDPTTAELPKREPARSSESPAAEPSPPSEPPPTSAVAAAEEPEALASAVAARREEPEEAELSATEIARRALASTVFIYGEGVYGAGLLVDAQGHVLTCNHVVDGLERIEVAFSDGTRLPAERVDQDAALDLALLAIDTDREPGLPLGTITGIDMGQDVFAMGAPKKMAFSLSRGMVSYVGRDFGGVYYMQSDVAINSGSSGGPVMNRKGEVVGLSSFILESSQGMAFALPIDYARDRFADHLEVDAGSPRLARFNEWLQSFEPDATATARR